LLLQKIRTSALRFQHPLPHAAVLSIDSLSNLANYRSAKCRQQAQFMHRRPDSLSTILNELQNGKVLLRGSLSGA
jgi:hypothetical protein